MPFNGSGTYTRVYTWTTDAAGTIPITASRFDTQETDMATALSNCITKDGQQTITADIPFNTHKITGLGNPVGAQDAATRAFVLAPSAAVVGTASFSGTAFIPTGSTVPANGIYLPSANTLGFATDSTQWGTVNATGNWTINAPSSGTALTVNGNVAATNFNGTTNGIIGFSDLAGANSVTVRGSAAVIPNIVQVYTNNVEAARFDASGNLGLGVTPSASGFAWKLLEIGQQGSGISGGYGETDLINNLRGDRAGGWSYVGTGYAGRFSISGGVFSWYNATGTAAAQFNPNPAMTLDASGNLTVPAMYATTVTTPRNVFIDSTGKMGGISSVRASKSNIVPLATAAWINALNPVTFNYRKRDEAGAYLDDVEDEKQYGLIAEDVEAINPDLCVYNIVDGQKVLAGVHYDRMIAPLIKAIQELTARLAALEAKP